MVRKNNETQIKEEKQLENFADSWCKSSNGWAMSQYLPYSKFTWLKQSEINKLCLNSIGENSSTGYILEADQNKLHEFYDYPIASEKIEISINMLSNYCSSIAIEYVKKNWRYS